MRILSTIPSYKLKKIKYYNVPCAFDIETSSFYEGDEKRAIMYVWQFAIDDTVIIGRTWAEFRAFVTFLRRTLELGPDVKLIVYVHNLSYEFGWIHRYFNIAEVMAIKELKPIKVDTLEGLLFRCSYLLTNQSLATLSKNYNLQNYKLSGLEYDYNKLRNAATPLSDYELDYICNDVLAVTEYIKNYEMPEYKNKISCIPNTSTAKTRRFCKRSTIDGYRSGGTAANPWRYRDLMGRLIFEPREYLMGNAGYMGGLTHANIYKIGRTLEDVGSMDFTSSYPASLCLFPYYPMGRGKHIEHITTEAFKSYIKTHACLMTLTFINIKSKLPQERIISSSKCIYKADDTRTDNGRIICSSGITITCTEFDYFTYRAFYSYDKLIVNDMYVYKRGYLPRDLIKAILTLYKDKTTLKGVEGEEINYQRIKEMLNSVYGCMCTSVLRPEITYDSERRDWTEAAERPEPDVNKEIDKYNKDPHRFLFYLWGVWCTAISRYNLIMHGIRPLGMDYCYCDTDSVKYEHPEKNAYIFERYNKAMGERIKATSKALNLPLDMFMPETVAGVKKPLGYWEYEGSGRFKTLGAKRYMTYKNGKYQLTVAGLSKREGMDYIISLGGDPFEHFTSTLYIPGDKTGKKTHTYITKHIEGETVDYLGNRAPYSEESYIHLEDCPYDFDSVQDFIKFAYQIQTRETII